MNNTLRLSIATSLLLAGCATAPPRDNALEDARAEVATLSGEPLAQQAAADDLKSARDYLQQGDTALQQKQPIPVVDHYAYLASRRAEAGQARVEEAQAKAQITAAQAERESILLQSRSREANIAKAQADDARAAADAAKNQADAAKSQADMARQQLLETQQKLADLQAKQTNRGMVLTLGDVLFDTGKATLKPGATSILARVASFMTDNPQTNVRIEGYTDSTGSASFNEVLSQNRAQAAAVALESNGVSMQRIAAVGKGPDSPVASNDTAAGRQQNRRVEIVFSDATGKFVSAGS